MAKGSVVAARTVLFSGDAAGGSLAIAKDASVARVAISAGAASSSMTLLRAARSARHLTVLQECRVINAETASVFILRGVSLKPGRASGFDVIAYDNDLITLIAA